MEDLPKTAKSKTVLVYVALFLLGAVVGAGGFYFYATKVMIPKYKAAMVSEVFGEGGAEWGDFFKKVEEETSEEEYSNPFEGGEGGASEEEYVNPFDVIE
jgi:hypothetical protein